MTHLAHSLHIRPCAAVALAASMLWMVPPAAAQETTADPPAHISFVDGTAVLERNGGTETASRSMPLLAGDRLRTDSGRIEVLFADGSTLHLDAYSVIDFQSDELIRLTKGRVRLAIAGPSRDVRYRIDAPAAWVEITQPGEYRVSIVPGDEVELAVFRGSAELLNEDGRTPLRAGERAFARTGAAPSYAYVLNSAAWDDFDRWSEARRDQRLGVSAQYLPETVRPYAATFDQYGSWGYDMSYGYVWYPTVAVGWRPYYYGRWASLRPWGWTWIGGDPWAWPTHHFGRWGFSAGVWFWIPGRTWGPAWVSWAYAPGYVSWCPLGWDNRAVFQFNAVVGGHWDSWHGWTVVPHHRFGHGFVNANVVTAARIDTRTRGAFVVRNSGPDFRGYAVPRSTAPISVAGTGRASSSGGIRAVGPVDDRRGFADSRAGVATSRARPNDDATAAFRSRGSSSGPVSGPGFPPAARAPRDSSVLTNRTRPADTSTRERANAPSTPETSASNPRAVPRNRTNDAPAASDPASAARRLEVPGYRRAPAPSEAAPVDRSAPSMPVPNRGVVTPRSDGGYWPRSEPRGVEGGGVAPRRYESYSEADRGRVRSYPDPGSYGVPRAMPREAPAPRQGGDGPPAGYGGPPPASRSAPNVERHAPSAPAGPPPSAQPSRSGPPSGGGDGGGRQRSSGGQPSGGQAVPRGGGRGR
jgi:hypothetical protein